MNSEVFRWSFTFLTFPSQSNARAWTGQRFVGQINDLKHIAKATKRERNQMPRWVPELRSSLAARFLHPSLKSDAFLFRN